MNIYEYYTDRKTKEEKIIINYPSKKYFPFFKELEGAKYYYNTGVWTLTKSVYNENKLFQNGFSIYNEEMQIKNILINNNYLYVYCYNEMTQYNIMKQYTFTDVSEAYNFGRFDAKKIKRILFFRIEDYCIKIPIGFKNDFSHFEMIDNRKKRKWKFSDNQIKNCLGYLQLYDIQIEAVKSCLNNTNGIVELVGGGGKTEIALTLIKLMNIKTLFITESIDLCKQTFNRAKKAKLDVGIIQGQNLDEDHQTVICTIQSSHKLKNKYEMIITDECHNVSEMYMNILNNPYTIYRFGLSATPFNSDKLKSAYTKSFIGDIIYTIDNKVSIDKGYIAEPIINIIEIDQPNIYDESNWYLVEKLGIINNRIRNQKIIDICKNKKGVLILIKKIKHGEILEKMLKENDIDCIYIHGKTKKKDRQEVLKRFETENFVLIGSTILCEGISIDNIFHLFLAGAGQSYFDTIQSLYRGTRVKLKTEFQVYDFNDKFNYITLRHSKQRISDYKKNGFNKINFF